MVGIKLNVAKAYVCFISNLCKVFEQTVLVVYNYAVTICDVYPTMAALRNKLKYRYNDHHFAFEVSAILESDDMPQNMKQKTELNLCSALQRAVSYLEQWFDFSDENISNVLQKLSLNDMPIFQDVKKHVLH